jgi:hypothetical protein
MDNCLVVLLCRFVPAVHQISKPLYPSIPPRFIIHKIILCKLSKIRPITGHEGPEWEYVYSSTLSLTSAVDRGWMFNAIPCRFTPGKENPYPLYRRLGVPQCRSGQVRKNSLPPDFDIRTVQLVASHCTDFRIPAHNWTYFTVIKQYRD